jgi:hypothetical protein
MQNYSKHDIVLVRYPFSDLSNSKVRPAIVVSAPHLSKDVFWLGFRLALTAIQARKPPKAPIALASRRVFWEALSAEPPRIGGQRGES